MTTALSEGAHRQGRRTARRLPSALAVVPVNCRFENMAVNQRLRALLTIADLDIVTCYPESLPPDIVDRAHVRSLPLSRRQFGAATKTLLFTIEVALWSAIQRLLRRSYEIVYTIQDTSAVSGWLLRAHAGRWVLDVLDDPALSVQNAIQNAQRVKACAMRAHERMTGALLRHADLLLTIGLHQQDPLPRLLTDHYGVRSSAIVPLRQCIDISRVREIARQSPTIDSGSKIPRITCVGYISALRGIDTLLHAGQLLHARDVNIRIVLIGHLKAREQAWLDSARRDLPGLDYLGVLPSSSALKEMARTTVGVLPFPDRRETAPVQQVTGIEFLALGKPIVATDLPGARAIVEHGVNGMLVTPGSPEAMAEAIQTIIADANLAESMGTRAYERAAMFDANMVRKDILNALRRS